MIRGEKDQRRLFVLRCLNSDTMTVDHPIKFGALSLDGDYLRDGNGAVQAIVVFWGGEDPIASTHW